MKQWFIIAVVVVGGYAAYQYYQKNKNTPGSLAATLGGTSGTTSSPYNDVAGVPVFDATAVTNRPDQVAAALHSNDASTLNGSFSYEPAFGPTTNQTGGTPVF